jgi:hypothetical protein
MSTVWKSVRVKSVVDGLRRKSFGVHTVEIRSGLYSEMDKNGKDRRDSGPVRHDVNVDDAIFIF